MGSVSVAYLGPAGTYSHLVARMRFGKGCSYVSFPGIRGVCEYVAASPSRRRGIIPIENSSGGTIYETVDILIENRPPVCILEELSLKVRLALLGRPKEKIRALYSHFAPLEHCSSWIRKHLGKVEKRVVASTAIGAQRAAAEPNAAALGSRQLASLYGLKVLRFPVEVEVENLTVFYAIGGRRRIQPGNRKSTLAVRLPNKPGSLCTFLEAFRDEQVNLSRIESRPIRGCPREYAFLVDVQGESGTANIQRALVRARRICTQLRVVGSYPCRQPYLS